MFGKIPPGSLLLLTFCLLKVFSLFITDSISLLVICSNFLIFPDLVLEDCLFLGVYLFLINCLICWRIIVCSSHF